MGESCADLLTDDARFTSHIKQNSAEVAAVAELFPGALHYPGRCHRHGLVTDRSIFAHNVHPSDAELEMTGALDAATAHCTTSDPALGSGPFPMRRHPDNGVGAAPGSDVGAGTGRLLLKEGLQIYFMQRLLGDNGLPMTPIHLLYLVTRAGARALGLSDRELLSLRS